MASLTAYPFNASDYACDLVSSTSLDDMADLTGSSLIRRLANFTALRNSTTSGLLDALESGSFLPPPCDLRPLLYVAMAVGALVTVLLTVPAWALAFAADFSASRVAVQAAVAAHRTSSWAVRFLSTVGLRPDQRMAAAAYALPFALVAGYAGAVFPFEPSGCWVFGLGIVLAGPAALLFAYAFGMWAKRRWHVSGRVLAAGAAAVLLVLLLQLLLVLQRPNCPARPRLKEFPHTAITGIAMALNLVPVTAVIYLSLAATQKRHELPVHREHLPRSTALVMLILGLRRSQSWPRLQSALLYVLSLALLALYSIFLALASERQQAAAALSGAQLDGELFSELSFGPPPKPLAGLYASLTVVLLDAEVYLYSRAGLMLASSAVPIVLMVVCRVALVVFVGEAYLFLVHSFVLLLACTLVGGLVAERRAYEANSRTRQLENVRERLRRCGDAFGLSRRHLAPRLPPAAEAPSVPMFTPLPLPTREHTRTRGVH